MSDEQDGNLDEAREEAERLGVGSYDRHIFLCTGPDCCSTEEGMAAWMQLKMGVAKINGADEQWRIFRTKVGCLRICREGPTAVVYPEGTWYGGLTPDALERVIKQDLRGLGPVEDLRIGENPIGGGAE